jgi:hypothetical protein
MNRHSLLFTLLPLSFFQYDLKTNEFNQKITSLHSESNYKWVQQILQKVHGVMPKRPQDDSSLFGEDELMDEL